MFFSRKLHANQLDELLSDLHDFFVSVPAQVRDAEREIISRINTAHSVHDRHNNEAQEVRDVAETVGDWLLEYFQCVVPSHLAIRVGAHTCLRHRFVSLEELPLWDVWYTGSSPFPTEVWSTQPASRLT